MKLGRGASLLPQLPASFCPLVPIGAQCGLQRLTVGARLCPLVLARSCPRDWPLGSLDQLTGLFPCKPLCGGRLCGGCPSEDFPILGSHVTAETNGESISLPRLGMMWRKGMWWQLTWHSAITGRPMVTIAVRFLWGVLTCSMGVRLRRAGAGEGPHGGISPCWEYPWWRSRGTENDR